MGALVQDSVSAEFNCSTAIRDFILSSPHPVGIRDILKHMQGRVAGPTVRQILHVLWEVGLISRVKHGKYAGPDFKAEIPDWRFAAYLVICDAAEPLNFRHVHTALKREYQYHEPPSPDEVSDLLFDLERTRDVTKAHISRQVQYWTRRE